jgi:PAS domain S-box-containing protein
MKKPSESGRPPSSFRDKIIGMGERSLRKSYYPQLQQQLKEAEKNRADLEEKSAALQTLLSEMEKGRGQLAASEARLRHLNRELRAISNCNQILLRATDEQSLLNEICRVVCEQAGYRMAWVGFARTDEAQNVQPVAFAGVEDGYLARALITWADTERGRGPTGLAIRTGVTSCVQDFAIDPAASPWREEAMRRGYRSNIALPLKDEHGRTFGTLTIYSTEPDTFTPDEIELLEELAGDLAFGITALRTRSERSRVVDALQLSEQRFRMAQTIGHVGNWEFNIQTGQFWGSDEAKRIYGFDPATDAFSTEEVENCIPERVRVHQALVDLIESNKPYHVEFEIHPKNSPAPRILSSIAGLHRDEKGVPLKVVGVIHDITEHRKSGEQIALLSSALNHVHEAAYLTDENARFLYVNDESCRALGYSSEELLRLGVADIDPDFPAERWPGHWNELKARRALEFEGRHRTKDGRLIPVEVSANYIEYGGKAYNLALVRDITERTRTAEMLHRREQEFRALVENSPDIIARYDRDCRRLYVNPTFLKLTQMREEQLLGVTLVQQSGLEAAVAVSVQEAIRHAITTGTPSEIDFPLQTAAYGQLWFAAHTIPEFDTSGQVVSAITIARDITARKRAEEALHRLNQELDRRVTERTAELEQKNRELERMNKVFIGRELRMVELKEQLRRFESETTCGMKPAGSRADDVPPGPPKT